MPERRYELCVIGAGTAGFAAAEEARAAGRDLLLVTGDDELGGTCIRRGCMPAKTLLAASEREAAVQRAGVLGIDGAQVQIDLPKLIRRKRALVDYFAEDRVHELEAYPLARGNARFVTEDAIVVGGRRVRAERFVIASGASVVAPAIPGLAEVETITSSDVLEMTRAPQRIAILGGGPVGCSFAQFFARVGAKVTLVQDAPELLRNDDPDVGAAVRSALERDGVDVVCGATVERAFRDGGDSVVVAASPFGTRAVRCDAVMLATNRRPNVDGLDLEAGRIAGDPARGVAVDAALRSPTNPRVYAAGDVVGRRSLVHAAAFAGRLAARNAYADRAEPMRWERWEAHAIDTQPQVAVAGRSERECRLLGIRYRKATLAAGEVGEALVTDQAEGFVKMLAREDDGIVVGITLVTADAIDLAGEAIMLVDRGMSAEEIAEVPHLHPTMSELFVRVAERLAAA
ncbi:mercuric reductase [Vulcanimicrobium alpinum]|uniref:Mercuric reductase n=1 Tax=Vulcanimicrobium alpinum TaxID=3016050 RepID=A0AAN1XUJ9_UNVUL|nr:FAD-dependent oxidoreductase [Vulcanimicrobium alpinum]BDE05778.1 mercuric reductase [Vulcanimicrobium alpinum]